MAKYSKEAGEKIEKVMLEKKKGQLKIGTSGKKVTSRKQAIAIGLSEARKEGAKVPREKSATKNSAVPKKKVNPVKKAAAKKVAAPKKVAKKGRPRKVIEKAVTTKKAVKKTSKRGRPRSK